MLSGSGNRMKTGFNPRNIPQLVSIQNGSILASFETNDLDKVSGALLYDCGEDANGRWCIQKVDSSTGMSIRFATQANNPTYTDYASAFTNHLSLNYDLFSVAF